MRDIYCVYVYLIPCMGQKEPEVPTMIGESQMSPHAPSPHNTIVFTVLIKKNERAKKNFFWLLRLEFGLSVE